MESGPITQPRRRKRAGSAAVAPGEGGPCAIPAEPNILVVDDQPETLLAFEGALAGLDATLTTASSGDEALRLVLQTDFAVILLDVRMPGLSGFETARLIRERERSRSTPILFLTAQIVEDDHVFQGYEAGAIDFMLKPVDLFVLRSKVRAFLEMHRQRLELQAEVQQRKAAEEQLRSLTAHLEERVEESIADARHTLAELQTLADSVPALISFVGRDCRYRMCNRGYEEWFGIPRDQIIGQHLRDVLGAGAWERVRPHLERALAGETVSFESQLPYAHGCARWVSAVYRPQRGPRGGIDGVVALVSDITDRVERELSLDFLVRLGDETRTMLDSEQIMTTVAARLAEHLNADRCAYAEIEPDEDHFVIHGDSARGVGSLVGRHQLSTFGKRTVDELQAGRTLLIRDLASERLTAAALSAHRAADIRALICVPLIKNGRLVAGLAVHQRIARDWTPDEVSLVETVAERSWAILERAAGEQRLRELNTALKEADRQKDQFVAMLAHELRNPLHAIRNATELLGELPSPPTDLERLQPLIARQTERLTHMVNDLLDVSRFIRGTVELRKEPVAIASLIQHAAETIQPVIDARKHSLLIRPPAAGLWVEGDPVRLEQVLTNLLHNAAKFTGSGGRITVSAIQEGQEAVISVRDTGVGIHPDLLPRVFEVFTQADRSVDRAQGGLGVGLALVRHLVQQHGGTITARSAGTDQGAEFLVRLPVIPGPVRRGAAPASSSETGTGRGRRVLLVEDNVDAGETLVELLENWGHCVRYARDGESGLEAAHDFVPEVVILDIGLPGMDGFEVARRLSSDPKLHSAALIALSGYGQESDRERGRQAGFGWHLLKPVNFPELRALVQQASGPAEAVIGRGRSPESK